jgi:hypothetical protein
MDWPMNFRVARRSADSTIYHPGQGLGTPLDDLAEYLQFDFDPDGVFSLPKNSVVTLSATIRRKSIYRGNGGRGRIAIDLQPAVDVAKMISRSYWRSQVWPARAVFDVFAILGELCIGNGVHRAAEFVDFFTESRLVRLITDSELAMVDQPSNWFSSRAQMFGKLDERELVKQLATFQVFHEVGHLIALQHPTRPGESSSADEENDELECDDFGCRELDRAYGSSLGVEFVESIRASMFLSILVWTLAQKLSILDDVEFRAQAFSTILRRSRAATVHVYRYAHSSDPPSEQQKMEALRHFPVFETLLRILDTFFTEAISNDPEMFNYQGSAAETLPVTRQALTATPPEEMRRSRASWEMIWAKEDNVAEEKANSLRTLHKARDHRPGSRPMLS